LKRFFNVLWQEKIASAIGLGILLLICAVYVNIKFSEKRRNETLQQIKLVAQKAEPDLIKWAQGVLARNEIKWQEVIDQNNNPVPPDYGTVKKEATPEWVENMFATRNFSYAWVDKREGITNFNLSYSGGFYITITLPGEHNKGLVRAWWGVRQ
jgi:hypothetical protein